MLELPKDPCDWQRPPVLVAEQDAPEHDMSTDLEGVIDRLKAFQDSKDLTRKRLFRACFGPDPPIGFESFEQHLQKRRLPKRKRIREESARLLYRGLQRARAHLHHESAGYRWLAWRCVRLESGKAGFQIYVGDYRFFRMLSNTEMVRGELHFGWHAEALVPYYWQRHSRLVMGNPKEFLYSGPVVMMATMVRLEGFTNGEMRPTLLKRGTPSMEHLRGKILTQHDRNGDDMAANVVLYREDVYERLQPSDEAIMNLLRNKGNFDGILE